MLWQWLSPPLAELRCYVLPVFWMTSCVQMWPGTDDARKVYTQSDSPGGSTDFMPWRTLKLTHQGQRRIGAESAVYDCLAGILCATFTFNATNLSMARGATTHGYQPTQKPLGRRHAKAQSWT